MEILGIIYHSLGIKQIYHCLPVFSHSANLVASTIFIYLRELREKNFLASTLYIQADNCAKETHNQVFFALMHFLVYKSWCQKIQLSSLHPGHTHNDVDACIFAPLS